MRAPEENTGDFGESGTNPLIEAGRLTAAGVKAEFHSAGPDSKTAGVIVALRRESTIIRGGR
jgi:hypothetical protein